MRCVVYRGVGGREVVDVEERADPEPGRFELLIEPAYAGLNPADVLQREGRHPVPTGSPPNIPGLEVAGVVIACGDGVGSFAVGDRVFGLVGGGGLADRVVAHEREVVTVPDTLDDLAAAAVPEAYITAYDAICVQANLGAGDTLLVNGANGGVGTAAVQIASAIGARVVAGVRTESLRPRVAALGATALAPEEAFAHVLELGGADVILELVGAPNMSQNLDAVARKGRIVVVGARPGDEMTITLRDLMTRRAHVMGTTLRTRPMEEKATLAQAFGAHVVPLLATGRVQPIVHCVVPLTDVADALEQVREPGKFGKIVLDLMLTTTEAARPLVARESA